VHTKTLHSGLLVCETRLACRVHSGEPAHSSEATLISLCDIAAAKNCMRGCVIVLDLVRLASGPVGAVTHAHLFLRLDTLHAIFVSLSVGSGALQSNSFVVLSFFRNLA
jgi:hypothetical protein